LSVQFEKAPHFERTTFILNPRSGTLGGKRSIIRQIDRVWGDASRNYTILVTTRAGEGTRLARIEAERGSELIVAVGGDGTLNEVVKGVLGREACVGLIPAGSGNGFARHWGISLNPTIACKGLLHPRIVRCDVGKADDYLFLVTFGCGLDAVISHRYATSTFRGLFSYFYHGLRAFSSYQSPVVTVHANGHMEYTGQPLLLTLANTKGYGGGTVIAPQAKADDGLLDLCIIDPLSLRTSLYHLRNLFNGRIERIPGYHHTQIREAKIQRQERGPIHVDGESLMGNREIMMSVLPGAVPFALPT